ncbi:B-cell receptor-associated protein 31-like [Xenia sp. Carnegie-2017]|uniref:B-cell receptor-associated protein 31-like n=1 Tax=Xenia sp. Carnegie-2017 TaxID=2897299 RepID=UPI001F041D73|nr:B-cell receptor-associated protein 31-like [Xenia sp. Carnegie-2017]
MSVQWTLAAGFLYLEMALLLLMCLPIVSSSRWSRIFESHFLSAILAYGHLYFTVFVVMLSILFLDSLRESYKFRDNDWVKADPTVNLRTSNEFKMRLFRAQRNMYITAFALFLLFVLRQIARLHKQLATALASSEAAVKQAKGVSDHCEQLMEEIEDLKKLKGIKEEKSSKKVEDGIEDILEKKNELLAQQEEELHSTRKDLEQMKKQAEGVSKEYDRLLAEHGKLQNEIHNKTQQDKKDE